MYALKFYQPASSLTEVSQSACTLFKPTCTNIECSHVIIGVYKHQALDKYLLPPTDSLHSLSDGLNVVLVTYKHSRESSVPRRVPSGSRCDARGLLTDRDRPASGVIDLPAETAHTRWTDLSPAGSGRDSAWCGQPKLRWMRLDRFGPASTQYVPSYDRLGPNLAPRLVNSTRADLRYLG